MGIIALYHTYFGGSGDDTATSIAVTADGSLYLTGRTSSPDLPIRRAVQPRYSGSYDGYVVSLKPDGSLRYAIYIGGGSYDIASGLAVDAAGQAVVVGTTHSRNFPSYRAVQPQLAGYHDGFVVGLTTDGSLRYATYLGGGGGDEARAVALDRQGNAYLTGLTNSADFPLRNALQPAYGGNEQVREQQGDAFVTAINPAGRLLFSTYLGGSGDDWANAIAVDEAGASYLTGATNSQAIATPGAAQPVISLGGDAFVAKLEAGGQRLAYFNYLGAINGEEGRGIAVDGAGAAYVVGETSSEDFPLHQPLRATFNPPCCYVDAFLTKVASDGRSLSYSTYLGGNGDDYALAVTVADGAAYVAGYTTSADLPTLKPVQPRSGGRSDAFLLMVRDDGPASKPSSVYLEGYNINGSFLSYWLAHDGDIVFGPPLIHARGWASRSGTPAGYVGPPLVEGKSWLVLTQYFSYGVLDLYSPDWRDWRQSRVYARKLGQVEYEQRYRTPPQQAASRDQPLTFTTTNKVVGGAFRQFWQAHGGRQSFGQPLTNEFVEAQPGGGSLRVQYFEYAVFERQPDSSGTVRLRPLGATRFAIEQPRLVCVLNENAGKGACRHQ